jgi:uncharacterized membrane protein YfcA
MLTPLSIGIITLTVLATSFISGIFGMAGGVILLGVLLLFLDVAPAMVLFGVIQFVSNGWRATLWWRYARWSLIWRYLIGSTTMFLLLRLISFIPDKATVYLALGLIPFAIDLLPKRLAADITRPGMPYLCGAFIMMLQLLAGAAGHVLDLFFQKSELDRRAIVGTKAVTQATGHLYRIAYFGSFAEAFDSSIDWWFYVLFIVMSISGTSLAAAVIDRMTDANFRLWSRRVIFAVSFTLLVRGCWLLISS